MTQRYSVLFIVLTLFLVIGTLYADDPNEQNRINLPQQIKIDHTENASPDIPHRDWGNDFIFYDDGEGSNISIGAPIWSRVFFITPFPFTLEGVQFQVDNRENSEAPCFIRVYSEDEDGNLDEILREMEFEGELPNTEWIDVEMDEEEYILFDANVNFSIIYGPAPSGDPDNAGEGWWNLYDEATEVNRSFIAQDSDGDPEDEWSDLDGDLLIRANGTLALPAIEVEPDSVGFGEVLLGESENRTITVTNSGVSDLTITEISVTGNYYDFEFEEEIVIEPDQNQELTITFEPDESGDFEDTLSITSNDPNNNPLEVPLTGSGVTPEISIIPEVLEFGQVPVGDSQGILLLITNAGTSDLTISDIATEDDGFSVEFAEELVLEPEETTEIPITFAPQDYRPYEGILTVTSDNQENPEINIPMSGEGLLIAIREVGFYDTPGEARGITIVGDLAFIADGGSGLSIVNISDPENPDSIATIDTPGEAYYVVVNGEYAYVADNESGVRIINISDTAAPEETGAYDTPHQNRGVALYRDLVLAADGETGLLVIDVTDPTEPELLGRYDSPGTARGVTTNGDYAYIADGGSGLEIIDLFDHENPELVGSFDTPSWSLNVRVVDNYAYIADYRAGLVIVDVSELEDPNGVGDYDTPGEALGVAIGGEYAYIADFESGLKMIDISDPENPEEAGFYDTPDVCRNVAVVGDLVYAACGPAGLRIYDISNIGEPIPRVTTDPHEMDFGNVVIENNAILELHIRNIGMGELTIENIQIEGFGFTTNFDEQFVLPSNRGENIEVTFSPENCGEHNASIIITSTDPFDPEINVPLTGVAIAGIIRERGFFDTPGHALNAVVTGDFAYIADRRNGLCIVDISNPALAHQEGNLDTPGEAYGVDVVGDYAFIADWRNGLRIINISNPAEPQETGSLDTPGSAGKIMVVDSVAYIADDEGGLRIINVIDPDNPEEISSWEGAENANNIFVVGEYAYITDRENGFHIIDISDRENPEGVATFNTPGEVFDINVNGDYAYVADGDNGLLIVNISNVENLENVGELDTPGSARSLFFINHYVHIADRSEGLRIIDVGDPANPFEIGFFDTPGQALSVTAFDDNFAYISDYGNGLRILDVSEIIAEPILEPDLTISQEELIFGNCLIDSSIEMNLTLYNEGTAELIISSFEFSGNVFTSDFENEDTIAVNDSSLVTVNFTSRELIVYVDTLIINSNDPVNPEVFVLLSGSGVNLLILERGRLSNFGEAWDLAVSGEYAYVTTADSGLRVINISDLDNMFTVDTVDTIETLGQYRNIHIADNYAYVAGGPSGLLIFDLTEPAHPAYVGGLDTPDQAWDVAVDGERAYVADLEGGLRIIDIVDPVNPTQIGSFDTDRYARGVTVYHGNVYIADGSGGLLSVDVSNPEEPIYLGNYNTPGEALSVDIQQQRAYVADKDGGLRIIDVSDPTELMETGGLVLPSAAYDIKIVNNIALVAAYEAGLRLIDCTIPDSLSEIGFYDTPGDAFGVEVRGDFVFVADGENGLVVLEVPYVLGAEYETTETIPSEFYLSMAYPNPFNSTTTIRYSLPTSSHVLLQVYNILGQQITTLLEGDKQVGIHSITFNASDLPSGMYFVQLRVSDHIFTQKVMLIR